MMFANGKEAVIYYVEARAMGFALECGSARMIEDEGFHLQYDANVMPGPPGHTRIIETLVDLEKIFADSLSALQIQFLLAWASNAKVDEEEIDPNCADVSRQARAQKILRMMTKLEAGLEKFKYLDKRQESKIRYRRVA